MAASFESAGKSQDIRRFPAQSLFLGPDQSLLVIQESADFFELFNNSGNVTPSQGKTAKRDLHPFTYIRYFSRQPFAFFDRQPFMREPLDPFAFCGYAF